MSGFPAKIFSSFVLFLPSTNNTQMKKNIVFLLILIPIIMDLLRWNGPSNQ